MLEFGILDPTKVCRTALQNAASISSLLIMTECAVVLTKSNKSNEYSAPSTSSDINNTFDDFDTGSLPPSF